MQHLVFVIVLALLFMILMLWGFKNLPEEKWQILASVPRHKHSATTWDGINFTFYGLFTAGAYTFSTTILIILLESVNISLSGLSILIVCILGICVPASRLIARTVEKKSSTFTVSSAFFTGIALTSLIFCTSGLLSVYLFLEGYYRTAFLQTIVVTQIWRFVSELLRADYRGEGKTSVYQILSGISVGLAVIFCWVFPVDALLAGNTWDGLAALWDPFVIILLQIIFVSIFIYTGRSQVTASITMFYVVRNRI